MAAFPYTKVQLPDGTLLAHVDQGRGPTLVMLHGFTGSAHRHFERLIEAFRSDHRVIAPDFRGYGSSRPPRRDFPPDFIERDADDIAAMLDVLNCSTPVVLGFSDGGDSALILAGKRPDLVRTLVIWGAFGQVLPSDVEWLNSLLPVESWGSELASWRDSIIEHHGQEQWSTLISGRAECAKHLAASGWTLPLKCAESVRCPVLQLHGEIEERVNRRAAAQLAAALPNSRVEIVPGGDHTLQFEKPDELVALIRAFLKTIET